jgi:uncharacterized protein (TIGR02145 family)
MRSATFLPKPLLSALFLVLFFQLTIFQSCMKTGEAPTTEEIATKRNPSNPPPPPSPFYFNNCSYPVFSGTFRTGVPANVSFTLNYVNSPGGSYSAFTSTTVNGLTARTPGSTFNIGSGSIVFTITGTPASAGQYAISVGAGSAIPCQLVISVLNPPADPSTCGGDPGLAPGSRGCVTFTYRGQSVTYFTVRAKDGKIWLQQNLGSPQVAFHEMDQASYGDYFQWGRWDDGHQLRTSPTITGGPALLNPSHISSGNPNFIKGTTTGTKWWSIGGLVSDTWSGSIATATNGKDPCAALGAGWRLPTATEWDRVSINEDLFGTISAFQSNLKLPSSGYRLSNDGFVYPNGDIGYYWTSTAATNSNAKVFFFDNVYNAGNTIAERGHGFSCRCVKD